MIFCSKKQTVKQLTAQLKKKGLNAADIHSDLDQTQREDVLLEFASKRLPILVATDILSRGIDIDQIELVINFDVPSDGEDYVHRIGRTARAATTGAAVTLINPDDQHKFQRIEKLIAKIVEKASLPESLGAGPEYGVKSTRNGPPNRTSKNKPSCKSGNTKQSGHQKVMQQPLKQNQNNNGERATPQEPRVKITITKQGPKLQ
ncbi:MAG: hypothetical protein RLZZ172_2684 [Bacteroidota bacterium]